MTIRKSIYDRRKIGGHYYRYHSNSNLKTYAQNEAKRLRAKGYKVRVVTVKMPKIHKTNYVVFNRD